jgi:predicted kinase
MTRLTICRGLPGAGKSTFAKEELARLGGPGKAVRVSKDVLRELLHFGQFTGKSEKDIIRARDNLIRTFLTLGQSVICDDTNLLPAHEITLRAIAKECGAEFAVKDFTRVSLSTCIKNDLNRAKSVGEAVIREMYEKFLAPPILEHNPDLPDCIIVDLDGTMAKRGERGPFDWARVGEDEVHEDVKYILDLIRINNGVQIFFFSGRDSVCKPQTAAWIVDNFGFTDISLHMRPEGDKRPDEIIKKELYYQIVDGRYNVLFILDDRKKVIDMWRSLGLPCFEVRPGYF